jgi:hypothetical protein
MNSSEVLVDGFSRVRGLVHRVVRDLSPDQLATRVDGANSIAWLVWHLTRNEDDHVAEVVGRAQVWTADGWFDRFALPFDPGATGYGHTSAEVDAVRVESGALLVDYFDAVHAQTIASIEGVTEADLDVVVDESWDPPVTLGVRLVSVLSDDLQHMGQAAILRGIITSR